MTKFDDNNRTRTEEPVKGQKKWVKNLISTVVTVLALVAGISLLLYPTFSNEWNKIHQTQAISTYQTEIDTTDKDLLDKLWNEAEAYNQDLLSAPDRYHMKDEELEKYENTLDISGTGIMGYIEIPEEDIYLPIYHDTTEGILEIAVGHLTGTSLPVTEADDTTHVVLTGHTGLPTRKLFTDIDKLKEGDMFQLIVLGRVLHYEVDQIKVVEPNVVEDLSLDDGKQYCTLITCTPYGINTHRLLVRGHWVNTTMVEDDPSEPSIDLSDSAVHKRQFLLILPFIGAAAAFAYFGISTARKRKKAKLNGKTGAADQSDAGTK